MSLTAENEWQVEALAKDTKLEIAIHDNIGRSFFSGEGVTSKDVLTAIRSNPNAKSIEIRINSNGGIVDQAKGIGNLLSERARQGVEITAYIDGMAASAGSFLLTFANRVVMPSNAFQMLHQVRSGAIGTAKDFETRAKLMRRMDEQLAEAYSAASARRGKNKTKEDFLAMFEEGDTYLDADESIAWGLADEKIEPLKAVACLVDVNSISDTAPDSLKLAPFIGAISKPNTNVEERAFAILETEQNSIAQPQVAQRRTAAAVGAAPQPRKKQMDEQELKAQHPELHAAVFAKGKAEGKKEGAEEALTAERDRVEAHLTYGKECGALDTAIAAVLDGTDLTKTVMARYMTAGRNKVDREDRDKDASVASDATAGAEGQSGSAEVADLGDQIVAQLESGKGQVKK